MKNLFSAAIWIFFANIFLILYAAMFPLPEVIFICTMATLALIVWQTIIILKDDHEAS